MNKKLQPKQKAAIALAALKGEKSSVLSSRYQVHPTQINRWAELLASEAETLFADKRKKDNFSKDRLIYELYKTIGQRDVELEWLKKKFKLELPREIRPGE
jgi:transposase